MASRQSETSPLTVARSRRHVKHPGTGRREAEPRRLETARRRDDGAGVSTGASACKYYDFSLRLYIYHPRQHRLADHHLHALVDATAATISRAAIDDSLPVISRRGLTTGSAHTRGTITRGTDSTTTARTGTTRKRSRTVIQLERRAERLRAATRRTIAA